MITDFKLRYQGSVLGYLWSLLKPLAIFTVLYFVFVKFLKVGAGVPHYAIYLLLGIILWNFFTEITAISVSSIVVKGELLRKINFPKYVIVLSSSFSALINLAFNVIVVVAFMLIFGSHFMPIAIIVFPILLIELYLFGLAFAFILSTVNVKYRDVGFIWDVLLQAGFYATPILYPMSRLPLKYQKILIFNPIAQIMQSARYYMVTNQAVTIRSLFSHAYIQIIPILFVVVLLVLGSMYFRKRSRFFAEEV